MLTHIRWIVFLSSATLLMMVPSPSMAQAPYYGAVRMARGQDITPAFEGWMANPDGTFTLYFGYMNRNYEEELDIPIGPNNNIEPGSDRGQPTHFIPAGRQHAICDGLRGHWARGGQDYSRIREAKHGETRRDWKVYLDPSACLCPARRSHRRSNG